MSRLNSGYNGGEEGMTMKEINIGRIIMKKRHEKGMTQEELANYIGVSKASVSKWETGQSYPDITFLPQLAALFNISIDELMGYEPQMNKEDIRRLYLKLSADFASEPFDKVIQTCRDIVRKYYSCFPLLFHIGALLVNHSMLAGDREKTSSVLEEAKDLFVRVREESDDAELAYQSLLMEAFCALILGNAGEAAGLLEGTCRRIIMPAEPLLASAYQMLGKPKEAVSVMQVGIYQYLVSLFSELTDYLMLCTGDRKHFEQTFNRALEVAGAFELEKLHPLMFIRLYLNAALGFAAQGNQEKALDVLEKYAEFATGNIYPLRLHGDEYFNAIGPWIDELDLGSNIPRDERIVRRSMVEAVTDNPAFASLKGEFRYRRVVEKLKSILPDECS